MYTASMQIRNDTTNYQHSEGFQSQTIPVISDLRYNLAAGLIGGFSA